MPINRRFLASTALAFTLGAVPAAALTVRPSADSGDRSQSLPLVKVQMSVSEAQARLEAAMAELTDAQANGGDVEGAKANVSAAQADLDAAVPQADLLCSATMTQEPLIKGRLIKPGTHVDLVGAYTPAMREADDETLQRGDLFVDSFATTIGHIGEVTIPLDAGTIARSDILGDMHALVQGKAGRQSDEDITVFKNGGGAHLDIMVAHAVARGLDAA